MYWDQQQEEVLGVDSVLTQDDVEVNWHLRLGRLLFVDSFQSQVDVEKRQQNGKGELILSRMSRRRSIRILVMRVGLA